MRWFKHDSDANGDAKLKRVRIKYGMEGYGLYWYCLELIASDVSKDKITFELEHDAEIIAHDTGIHYERVQEMMTYMVNLGLFEQDGGIITCIKMAQRIDQSMTSNPHMRQIIQSFKPDNHDGVMTLSAKPMQDKTRLDKNKKNTSSGDDSGSTASEKVLNSKKQENTPYQAIVDSYHQRLPMLPRVKALNAARKKKIRTRWEAAKKDGKDITYFDGYFDYVSSAQDFYIGASWCNLEWLMTEKNFLKMTEGGCHDK